MANNKTKTYSVTSEIEVSLLNLTDEQIEAMNDEDTLDILFSFKQLYKDTEEQLKNCEKYSHNYQPSERG